LTICSGTKFDSSSGTTGGFGTGTDGTGTGTGGTGTGTGGTGTNQAVNCQGCATESTLAAIKGILDPAGKDGKGATDGAGTAEDGYKPADDAMKALQAGNGPFKDMSWSFGGLFPASAQCQPFTLNVNGRVINQSATLDVCDWINLARAILGWLCYVLTAIGIYRIATGQKSQGEAV
jgi:hypothetical protein